MVDRTQASSGIRLGFALILVWAVNPLIALAQTAAGGAESFSAPATKATSCMVGDWKKIAPAKLAYEQVGKHYDSNRTPYNNYIDAPWCASFAVWVYNKTGRPIKYIDNSRSLLEWFAAEHNNKPDKIYAFSDPTQTYPGDIVVWKRLGTKVSGHTGIVVAVDPCANNGKGKIWVAEGNTENEGINLYTYTMETIKTRGEKKKFKLYGFGRWR